MKSLMMDVVNEGRQMTEKEGMSKKRKKRFFNTQGEKSDNGQIR